MKTNVTIVLLALGLFAVINNQSLLGPVQHFLFPPEHPYLDEMVRVVQAAENDGYSCSEQNDSEWYSKTYYDVLEWRKTHPHNPDRVRYDAGDRHIAYYHSRPSLRPVSNFTNSSAR